MPTTQTAKICSKCNERPRYDESGSNPWCKECRAAYQKEYVAGLHKQNAQQSFARGVKAMREFVASEFDRLGLGQFNGMEAAEYIRGATAPKFED